MRLTKALLRKKRKKESWAKYIMALLHLWLGLLASVVIMMVCLTGSIYAFKNQVTDAFNRDKRYNQHSNEIRLPLEVFRDSLAHRGLIIQSITLPVSADENYRVTYRTEQLNTPRMQYFDPYTAKALGSSNLAAETFFGVVLDLHQNLLLSRAGKQIVGASVLIFIFTLFSGLVLWWPKKWKELRKGLTVKFRAKFHRVNYDLHNTLGFYSLIFLVFIALTGIYITYPWMKNLVITGLGGPPLLNNQSEATQTALAGSFQNVLQGMIAEDSEGTALDSASQASLDSIMLLSDKLLSYPGHTILELPDEKSPRFTITKINRTNWLGALLPDVLELDKTGELKSADRFADKALYRQFLQLSRPLHTGEILGLTGIIFYSLVSLIGCSLPITGFIIWWKKVI